jgi:hypothetical protein
MYQLVKSKNMILKAHIKTYSVYVLYYEWRLWDLVEQCYSNNSMDLSPWGAYSITAGHEIVRLLWELKFHYRVCRIPPLGFILDQLNSVSFLTSNLSKIILNIIIRSVHGSRKWPHSLQVSRLKLNMSSYFAHACPCSFTTMKDNISLNRKKIPGNFVVVLNMSCLLSVILYNRVFDTELTAG